MKRSVFAVLACVLSAQSGLANTQTAGAPPPVLNAKLPDQSLSMPSVATRVLPPYPDSNTGTAVTGEVDVEIVVATDGTVADARVSKALEPSIDGACRTAAAHWAFRPALSMDHQPFAVLVLLRFEFASPSSADRPGSVTATLAAVPDGRDIADGASQFAAAAPISARSLQPPKLLRNVQPSYTAEASQARIQGEVTLNVLVLADGTVGFASVARSLDTQFGLDDEALRAVRHWLFVPATLGGQPVPSRATVLMSFTLR